MLNNWGYETAGELPDLLSVSDFDDLTGHVLSSDDKHKAAMLHTVSAAIRNYCGWHVGPVLDCKWTGDSEGNFVDLPVLGVKQIREVTLNGSAIPYQWKREGQLRVPVYSDGWNNNITVRFSAGYDTDALASAVAQIATNALVASPGIRNETVSGVSVSYNTVDGVSGGIRLTASDKELLAPYKLSI